MADLNGVFIVSPVSDWTAMRYANAALELRLQPTFLEISGSESLSSSTGLSIITLSSFFEAAFAELAAVLALSEFGGVVPGSELAVPFSNFLAAQLGLMRHHGDIMRFRDKSRMRETLSQGLVEQPEVLALVKIGDELPKIDNTRYPVVIKPVNGVASMFVKKCTDSRELFAALKSYWECDNPQVGGIVFTKDVLIESYVEGSEYSIEVVVVNGVLKYCFVTQKILSEEPFFDEIGHVSLPANDFPLQGAFRAFVQKVIAALDFRTGVAHVEVRVDAYNNIRIIEIGARIAGDLISDSVQFAYGISLEREFLAAQSGLQLQNQSETVSPSGVFGVKVIFEDQLLNYKPADVEILKEKPLHFKELVEDVSPRHVLRRRKLQLFRAQSVEQARRYVYGYDVLTTLPE